MVAHICSPSAGKVEAGDREFKVSLSYTSDEFQVSLGYMTACLKQARITMPLIANF